MKNLGHHRSLCTGNDGLFYQPPGRCRSVAKEGTCGLRGVCGQALVQGQKRGSEESGGMTKVTQPWSVRSP